MAKRYQLGSEILNTIATGYETGDGIEKIRSGELEHHISQSVNGRCDRAIDLFGASDEWLQIGHEVGQTGSQCRQRTSDSPHDGTGNSAGNGSDKSAKCGSDLRHECGAFRHQPVNAWYLLDGTSGNDDRRETGDEGRQSGNTTHSGTDVDQAHDRCRCGYGQNGPGQRRCDSANTVDIHGRHESKDQRQLGKDCSHCRADSQSTEDVLLRGLHDLECAGHGDQGRG